MQTRNLRDSIRERANLYIGSSDTSGLHTLVYHLLTFALDSTLAGLGDRVAIAVRPGGELMASGNGCPALRDDIPGAFALLAEAASAWSAQAVLERDEYRLLQGPYRMELPIVAALCRRLTLEMCDGSTRYRQEYLRGIPCGAVACEPGDGRGFVVHCDPDPEVLPARDYEFETLIDRFREVACLTRGLRLEARDEREDRRQWCGFAFQDGPAALLRHYTHPAWWALHDAVGVACSYDGLEVAAAVQYHAGDDRQVWAFSNAARVETASTPLDGLYKGLHAALSSTRPELPLEAIRRGLTAVVSIAAPTPPFDFGTYSHFSDQRAQRALESVVRDGFARYLAAHPEVGESIVHHCLGQQRAPVST